MSTVELKRHMPDDAYRGMVIWLDSSGVASLKWLNLSKEEVAICLYKLADEVVSQLPPKVDMQGKALK